MSGADLANLVNEAALLAARRSADKVYLDDLEQAKDKVMLGAERKSMVMKDDEKRNTAYHEAGHAVCAIKTPGCDPLHKVTIVPRGRALGLAFTLPVEDRYSITRQQLEAMLVMTYGGRVAEELVFGHDKVTTGAANDIQKATSLARRYVSQWGLSDAIGPVLVGDNEQEVFLGRELSRHREVSERTAQLVDAEVTRLLNDSYGRAKQTLIDNRDLLERMAEALLERETLTADDAAMLVQGIALPPRKTGAPPAIPVPMPGRRRAAEAREAGAARWTGGRSGVIPAARRHARVSAVAWRLATRALRLNRPLIMGIINVTPDSFSDGGKFFSPSAAAAHGRMLIAMGADLLDVGGESTRPQGATPVSRSTRSLQRVHSGARRAARDRIPSVPLSVDTVKSAVAREALAHGAEVINDVSGFRLDPGDGGRVRGRGRPA